MHRALHDNPGVNPLTKDRVLQMARTMGYRPNLAARYLSSKKTLRISVNTLRGTTSFWDEVRTGIREAAASILLENIEVEFAIIPVSAKATKRRLKRRSGMMWMGSLPSPAGRRFCAPGFGGHRGPGSRLCA